MLPALIRLAVWLARVVRRPAPVPPPVPWVVPVVVVHCGTVDEFAAALASGWPADLRRRETTGREDLAAVGRALRDRLTRGEG